MPLTAHIGKDALVVRDGGVTGAVQTRLEAINDYHANRVAALKGDPGSYRPLEPDQLYLSREEWDAAITEQPMHITSPFHEPESASVLDFSVDAARDFAPERAQNANVYDAVAVHIENQRKAGRKIVIASYSGGARERLSGLLTEHKAGALGQADSWQEAQGLAAKGATALIVLPLDHGFTSAAVTVLTEQDMLGDRLVRRRRISR